ncbi:hypothetical protein NKH02_31990 [Mesorhizobium sp. M1396]
MSKRGNKLTRTHLYEAANVILARQTGISSLRPGASGLPRELDSRRQRSPWHASSLSFFTPCGRRTNHSAASSWSMIQDPNT